MTDFVTRDVAAHTTREYVPPSDDQLARFVTVMVHGPGYDESVLMLTQSMLGLPELRAAWLERHREMQEAAWTLGDEHGD